MKELENINTLIDNAGDFIVVLDENFHPLYANFQALESLAISKEQLLDKGLKFFVHPDDIKVIMDLRKRLLGNPDIPITEKIRYISKDGKILQYETNCTYISEIKNTIVINRNLEVMIGQANIYDQAKKLAKIGVWEYCIETNVLYWDDFVYEIYELNKKSEISFDRMRQFFRKESLKTFDEEYIKLSENGTPLDLQLNFISGKFKPSTARFTGKLVTGKVNKIVGTIQDLTDQRRLERKSEDYKEAVDKSSIVSITDRDGIISEVNDLFCELSGYKRDELIGNKHTVVNSGFHPNDFWVDLWKRISAGRIWTGEIKNQKKNGDYFWVNTTIIPFKNSVNTIYQYLCIQTDISDSKRMTEELMVSEKLSSIGEISAQILHEVMTPLSIISLSIENLEEDIDELQLEGDIKTSISKNLGEVMKSYDRIEKIFENMRSLLVQKSGEDTEAISVKETFLKSLSLVNAKLTSKDIELKIDDLGDEEIVCSTSELSQVFINLLNNAVDAISDLDERWIQVSTRIEGAMTKIIFTDSGKGIPEEVRVKIFENLFTTKGDKKGTGLGMGICKKLIERNQGKIEVAAKYKNTTFEITFPNIHAL